MGVFMIILERHQALGTIKACPHGYGTASSGLTVAAALRAATICMDG